MLLPNILISFYCSWPFGFLRKWNTTYKPSECISSLRACLCVRVCWGKEKRYAVYIFQYLSSFRIMLQFSRRKKQIQSNITLASFGLFQSEKKSSVVKKIFSIYTDLTLSKSILKQYGVTEFAKLNHYRTQWHIKCPIKPSLTLLYDDESFSTTHYYCTVSESVVIGTLHTYFPFVLYSVPERGTPVWRSCWEEWWKHCTNHTMYREIADIIRWHSLILGIY